MIRVIKLNIQKLWAAFQTFSLEYIPIQNYQALFFWRFFLLLQHELLFFSCLIMSWHKHSSKCMAFVHWRYHKVSSVHIYKNFKYRTLHYIIELRVQSSTTLFQLSRIIQQQQHSLFSQASWGRLEMKPERNKFKVQAHW